MVFFVTRLIKQHKIEKRNEPKEVKLLPRETSP